ncbi:MAG: tRNA (N(6)-L-threonylcarbamoyladenosine(37)-C(2))-methylthiotransferase MtaB [candidate division Zixibacteria bacterium]|nr:tRNA (N(6)-L-threonylcarbamoyladenosine(37)-C(2))-methylthiotransferase MtaB [candidate division Zixibacteria bacterium]
MNKLAIKTIGCKLNQYDSQSIAEPFLANGFRWVKFDSQADIYIINSCTVTGRADYSSRQALSRAIRRRNENSSNKPVVVFTGCYAEVDGVRFDSNPDIDLVVGTQEKSYIYERVMELIGKKVDTAISQQETSETERWGRAITGMKGFSRAFIKIQDGCNSNCAYCIVPRARGSEISRRPEEIYKEIERLENSGYKEVVLTGVHIGRYNYNDFRFHHLLRDILSGNGPRIRFSSLEPNEITDELIDTLIEQSRLCRHIHIPVQSGSDEILRSMRRGYKAQKIKKKTELLSKALPGINLGADFIVGFPGETERDFKLSYDLAESCGFGYLHVFSYSDRPATIASGMSGKVTPVAKSQRSKQLRELSSELLSKKLKSNIGQTGEIVVESRLHRKTGMNTGISDNYLRAILPGKNDIHGSIVKVRYLEHAGNGKYQYLISEKIDG